MIKFGRLLLAFVTCVDLTTAVPFHHDQGLGRITKDDTLQTRAVDANTCPGYTASNIVTTDSSLTADLTLSGAACNVYSDDIKDLKLVVEHQTSKY